MEKQVVTNHLSGFAQFLVSNKILSNDQAVESVNNAAKHSSHLIIYLTQSGLIPSDQLAEATALYFGLPHFDLSSYDLTVAPKELLQSSIVLSHFALPLFINDQYLYVAVTDPTLPNLNELSFLTGFKTTFVIVESDKLSKMIDTLTDTNLITVLEDVSDDDLEELNINDEQELISESSASYNTDDAPVVKYINKILVDAINQGASDIHFEPYEKFYRIRLRLDGILSDVAQPPIKFMQYITARLKIMSNLDISERRIPQDGRFKLKMSKRRTIDFRVSICPTMHGEKIVLRILESSTDLLDINLLGLFDDQKKIVINEIQRSQGMILVTGPTGSGKTITLYTLLRILNTVEDNISTVEDPVEIQMPGINQVQINLKTGLDFATALRAFLRQDPDIIMVGEIRDLETAEIAVKASQTGHLVLSTLHTNSAPETLVRLANMGIPSYNIASSISLIIAQRLVRRLCDKCKKPFEYPTDVLLTAGFKPPALKNATFYKPTGCEHCHQGFKGRIGIYEVLPISEKMSTILLSSGSAQEIAKQAREEGYLSLYDSGLEKVSQGITTLEEVNRVITC